MDQTDVLATALFNNVGASDVFVTFTATYGATAGAGTIVISYAVRNPDGTTTIPYTQA